MDRYAVIGNPIAHSKSPFIHQAFAQQCQQILEYRAECAPLEGFAAFIQNLHQAGLKGANVTVPFKLEAFNLATEHTARALAAGAVNTLKFMESGHILGDNTDGAGLVYDLARLDFKLEGQRILLLGAGGAAQGVIQPLLNCKPASLVIANRTFEKAQALAARFHQTYNNIPVSSAHFETLSPDFHGIINASASSLKADLPPLPTAVY